MNALIPNKDTVHLLSELQKKIINGFNTQTTSEESFLFPQYPLAAFFDEINDSSFKAESCTIFFPETENEFLYFPVEVCCPDSTMNLKIIFARTAERKPAEILSIDEEIKKAFPIRERSFKTAAVILENNSWQIFDEKWHKTTF